MGALCMASELPECQILTMSIVVGDTHRGEPVPVQIILTLGIVVAQAINLGTQHIPGWGWRVSLACAGIPALVLTAGGLLLPDTPNSLIDRGHEDQGKQVRVFQKAAVRVPLQKHC